MLGRLYNYFMIILRLFYDYFRTILGSVAILAQAVQVGREAVGACKACDGCGRWAERCRLRVAEPHAEAGRLAASEAEGGQGHRAGEAGVSSWEGGAARGPDLDSAGGDRQVAGVPPRELGFVGVHGRAQVRS